MTAKPRSGEWPGGPDSFSWPVKLEEKLGRD
jgi:hypothetical protein